MLKEENRPSKHIIVDASISYHKTQQNRCAHATEAINMLIAERDGLLQEVNALRALYQPGACEPRQATPLDPTVQDMLTGNDQELVWDPVEDITSSTTDRQPHILTQAPLPRKSPLSTRQQASLPTPAAGPHPAGVPATPGDPVLLSLSPGINIQSPSDWAWGSPGNSSHSMLAQSNFPGSTTTLWNQNPDISASTQPKDVTIGFDLTSSHPIDDTALFWTQFPGILTTTPTLESEMRHDTTPSNIAYESTFDWHNGLDAPNSTPPISMGSFTNMEINLLPT